MQVNIGTVPLWLADLHVTNIAVSAIHANQPGNNRTVTGHIIHIKSKMPAHPEQTGVSGRLRGREQLNFIIIIVVIIIIIVILAIVDAHEPAHKTKKQL